MSFRVSGHDGKSADLPGEPKIKNSPVISKAPYLASASACCVNCGTSQALSGRPGTSIDKFTCRSCKSVNKANGDLGFSFWGQN